MAINLTFLDFERIQIPYPLLDMRDVDECMSMDAPSKFNELMGDHRPTMPASADDTSKHILYRAADDGDCVEFINVRMRHLDWGDYGHQSIYQTDDPFIFEFNGLQYERVDDFAKIIDAKDRLLSQAATIVLMDRFNASGVKCLRVGDELSNLGLMHLTSKDKIKIEFVMLDGSTESPNPNDLNLFQSLWNHFQIKTLSAAKGAAAKLSQVDNILAEHALIDKSVLESIVEKSMGPRWFSQYTERQLINMVIPHHVARI